jgi:hypothetical protein
MIIQAWIALSAGSLAPQYKRKARELLSTFSDELAPHLAAVLSELPGLASGPEVSSSQLPFVLLLGGHSSGKSSFVNHLLGRTNWGGLSTAAGATRNLVQAQGVGPSTDKFTVIANRATPFGADNAAEDYAPADHVFMAKDLGLGELRYIRGASDKILLRRVHHPQPLGDYFIVDTPGILARAHESSRHADRAALISAFAERASAIVFFFDPANPGTQKATIEQHCDLLMKHPTKVLTAFNKVNTAGGSVRELMRSYGVLLWNIGVEAQRRDAEVDDIKEKYYMTYFPDPMWTREERELKENEWSQVRSSFLLFALFFCLLIILSFAILLFAQFHEFEEDGELLTRKIEDLTSTHFWEHVKTTQMYMRKLKLYVEALNATGLRIARVVTSYNPFEQSRAARRAAVAEALLARPCDASIAAAAAEDAYAVGVDPRSVSRGAARALPTHDLWRELELRRVEETLTAQGHALHRDELRALWVDRGDAPSTVCQLVKERLAVYAEGCRAAASGGGADDGIDFVGAIAPSLDRALALVERYKAKTFALRDNSTVGTGRAAAAGTGAEKAAGFFCAKIGWC